MSVVKGSSLELSAGLVRLGSNTSFMRWTSVSHEKGDMRTSVRPCEVRVTQTTPERKNKITWVLEEIVYGEGKAIWIIFGVE